MRFFNYDLVDNKIQLDQHEIILVNEFWALLDDKRNKCKEDSKGTQKKRAFREFTYIYLMYDWQSPYSEYPESDRQQEALYDAGMSEADLKDELLVAAIEKYRKLQESDRSIRLIKAAQNKAEQLIEYFDSGSNLFAVDANGKPVYKAKDVMEELTRVGNVIDQLDELEARIKSKQKAESSLRAGAIDGFLPKSK